MGNKNKKDGVDLDAELATFNASCKVVDLILLLKRGHADASHRLALVDELEDEPEDDELDGGDETEEDEE